MISQKGDLSYLQVLAQLARFEVPHFHKTVHTPGNQKLAIRGEHGTLCIAVPPLINWHLWAGERGCVGCLPGWLFFVNLMLGPPCVSASASRTSVHWHAVGTHLSWICFLLVVPHRRRPAEQVKRCPGRQLACCGQQPARQTLAKRGDALPAPNLGSAATSMPGR